MSPRFSKLIVGIGIGVGSLVGAPPAVSDPSTGAPLMMTSSSSCEGLRDLIVDTAVHQALVGGYGYHPVHPRPIRRPMPKPTAAPSRAPAGEGKSAAPRASAPSAPPSAPMGAAMDDGGYAEIDAGPSH